MTYRQRYRILLAVGSILLAAGCAHTIPEHPVNVDTITIAQEPVRNAAGAVFDSGAVVWGGTIGQLDAARQIADGWIVPTAADRPPVRTAPGPIAARSRHVAAAHAGLVYLWGGSNGGTVFADGAVLDPRTNTWQPIPPAPVGLASAQAIVQGDRIIIGGGADSSGRNGNLILIYDTQRKTWTSIDAHVTVLAFAASPDRIVTVARGTDNRTLQLGRFRHDQPAEPQFAVLRPGLLISDNIAVTDDGTTITVAVSDHDTTKVYRLDPNGQPDRQADFDAAAFTPGLGTRTETSRTVRDGDNWLAIDSYYVHGFSIGRFTGTGMWQLDACRDAATWIPLGDKRFLRYGGQPCGGDVPRSTQPVLAIIRL
ncbi:kelch repeat-containing protein [Dactylosporangium sp. NPDC048998]|uniref:Kelch repeat-containing protein n=1 Tax=Dactylosporangium sp. NPDC048998 TaxID=3363976 RepID=UPI0037116D5F